MSEQTGPATVGFDFIDRRVMAAVERVASSDPNPADPFRGLYISDDRALELSRGDSVSDADDRLAQVARALGLDLLDAAVLAICAAPELNPRYGRLYAYLQDDVTRKLPSPRLVGHLLAGDGVSAADVMMAFERTAPLRAQGRDPAPGRRADAARRAPDQALGPARRAPARRRDGRPAGRRQAADGPAARPRPGPRRGRRGARAAMLAHPSTLPVVLAGPDAEALVAKAYGRALVVAHIREIDSADTMAEAALIAALEERPLVFEGLEDVEPGERARLLRAIERRGERVVVCAPNRNAALALGDRTSLLIEAAAPSFAERQLAWQQASGADDARDVAAKFRLSIGQILEAAEVSRLAAAARGARVPEPAELDLGARQASSSRLGELATRIPPGYTWDDLVVPDRQRELLQLDQRLPAPPRPRAVRVGLREDRRPHPGAEGAVRRRVRHRQDDVGAGARRRARAGDVPRRPRHDRVEVHRRDREEPRPHLQRRRGLQRDPVLRRGRRAVRQALGDLGLARPLREHRGRLPAAEDGGLPRRGDPRDELPAQHRRRVRPPAGLRDRLPVPRGRGPRADLGARAARHARRSPTTSTSRSSRRTSSSRAARSRTARSRPRSRPPTTAT